MATVGNVELRAARYNASTVLHGDNLYEKDQKSDLQKTEILLHSVIKLSKVDYDRKGIHNGKLNGDCLSPFRRVWVKLRRSAIFSPHFL
jgi:hypothetical protein